MSGKKIVNFLKIYKMHYMHIFMVFLHKIFISFYFKVKIILRCDKRIKKTKRRVYIYRSKIIKGELEIN